MAANARDVLDWIWYAYNNKFGYIWGTCWITWTQARQNAATREMTVKYGSQWIGHTVCDCAGLLRGAMKKVGEDIHAGSNLIFDCDLSAHGRLKSGKRTDGKDLLPATAVFTGETEADHGHVGMYVGNGTDGNGIVIEAAGTRQGVIQSKITDKKWTWWGTLKKVDYSDGSDTPAPAPGPVQFPTLRKGDRGEYVTLAQTKLIQAGYSCGSCGADGIFGNDTAYAVKKFQLDNALQMDGVIGPATWNALNNPASTELYTVRIPFLPYYKAEALVKQYTGASMENEGGRD